MDEKYTLAVSSDENPSLPTVVNTESPALTPEQATQLNAMLPKVTFSPSSEIVDSIVQLSQTQGYTEPHP